LPIIEESVTEPAAVELSAVVFHRTKRESRHSVIKYRVPRPAAVPVNRPL